MPDDDFRVVVGRDDRRRAGTRMIARHDSVWVGAVVLLEPSAVGREGRERRPGPILGEWALRADEARGCDRPLSDHHARHQRECEQTAQQSAPHTELAQRAWQVNEFHVGSGMTGAFVNAFGLAVKDKARKGEAKSPGSDQRS